MAGIMCTPAQAMGFFDGAFTGLAPDSTATSLSYLGIKDGARSTTTTGTAAAGDDGAVPQTTAATDDGVDWGGVAAERPAQGLTALAAATPTDFALLENDPATMQALKVALDLAAEDERAVADAEEAAAAAEDARQERLAAAADRQGTELAAVARTAAERPSNRRGEGRGSTAAQQAAEAAAPLEAAAAGGAGASTSAAAQPELGEDEVPEEGVILTGYCRMFHQAKRFGFIQCDRGGEDVYVAADDILDSTGTGHRGLRVLFAGEPVAFEVRANQPRSQRRLRAVNVTGQDGSPVYVQNKAHRRVGVVRHFASEKQYGFITPKSDTMLGDVFFHATNVVWAVANEEDREIDVGMLLEYTLLEPDGSVTFNVAPAYRAAHRSTGTGRRVGVCVMDAGFTALDPLYCPRTEGEGDGADAAQRRERQKQRKEKREREAGPQLVSGFDEEMLATW